MQPDIPHYVTSLISCHTVLFIIRQVSLRTVASNGPNVLPHLIEEMNVERWWNDNSRGKP